MFAIGFVLAPTKSEPSDSITWRGTVLYIVLIGVILDNLLIAFRFPLKKLQLCAEITIYLYIIIEHLLSLLSRNAWLSMMSTQVKDLGIRPILVTSFLLMLFLIIGSSLVILVGAIANLSKLKISRSE